MVVGAGAAVAGLIWAVEEILSDDASPDEIDKPQYPTPAVPANPADAPGEDWVWKGTGEPGSVRGSWVRGTRGKLESFHPDLEHAEPIGPHYDWVDPSGREWRVDLKGNVTPK